MKDSPPNILFIMSDQMAAPILPIYDINSKIKMPNLVALAEKSVVFDSAYCASPLCAPSRFSLLSGKMPSKIAAWDNAANFAADIPTYAHCLRLLGYKTALSGKMHFCGPDQLHGFEKRLTTDIYPADYAWSANWDQPELRLDWFHNMLSVLQAGPCVRTNQLDFDAEVIHQAQQYLYDYVRNNEDDPFCLTVSFTHPHDPYTITTPYWNLYHDEEIPLPKIQIQQQDQDPHSQRLLKVIDLWNKIIPSEKIRDARRAYFGACSYIDEKIGILRQVLAECHLSENTIIVFAGDHGDMLGERNLWYKMNWFEMSARVPLLVYAPKNFSPKRVKQSVSTIDLMPTFIELANGTIDSNLCLDGRSLLPHLENRADAHDEVFGEYTAEGSIEPLIMIRRGNYKFIYSETDPYLLFDLTNDPDELVNLALSSPHLDLVSQFVEEIKQTWNLNTIKQAVLNSQRQRRIVYQALSLGKITHWDYQVSVDASQQYMRSHLVLDDLESKSRYPAYSNVKNKYS